MTPREIDRVGEIWLESSIIAHGFVPAGFWRDNRQAMIEQHLPQSEVCVNVTEGIIDGFSAVNGDFIHCLFVDPDRQGRGVGSALLSKLQESHQLLQLKVYTANSIAVQFYESHGFGITEQMTCSFTGQQEYLMVWQGFSR